MARIINLTLARNIEQSWENLSKVNPTSKEFLIDLESMVNIGAFKELIIDIIENKLTVDNIDIVCFIIEEYYPALLDKLLIKNHIYYINERIKNCIKLINAQSPDLYEFAFPLVSYKKSDSRINFLESILSFVELMDKDHQTILELFNTPIPQYEQMIHFISFFQHEKIPLLLEKLSYFKKKEYISLTIKPIGQFKNKYALQALSRLEEFYKVENPDMLPMIYMTLQKLVFNRPSNYL
ncbi:MAG: hypothetical protein A2Y40_03545 [Candidatus Margulisbacteria bacterium GWF2_35_9]|nr:MAG: hypothetical protein A2Y40_03545 [Candidatus Margulisbacteria bacterium GWF2_35_9]